ncbi:hypothetical protein [Nocardioides dongkuii]|uniref:hypothetical protein n=1 Tax=Nocardioides dongkuii TaxID=2760089 RepID=UPI0018789437|nr:hypothetical protein [Nocardioides dongkuii]
MTATRRPLTRGPLPAGVYWRRRLLVLGVALLLVLGLGRLLGGGSDGSSEGDDSARLSGAAASPSGSADDASPTSSAGPRPDARPRKERRTPAAPTSTVPVPAVPDGPCVDSDISVTPSVTEAVAGQGVVFALELRTITDDACTWKVSPRSLTLKVTSGTDDIWSTRECPRPVPDQDVTVRREIPTTLVVEWNARRSDEECSGLAGWAMLGWYHVSAAALGGEPAEVQFELVRPTDEVTVAPEPKSGDQDDTKKKNKKKDREQDGAKQKQKQRPSAEPSGAVEPDQT